ncbi:YheC/YheD family protein [Ammoniphilus sp. 3BR4]|uniref:YheC/YheD family protein n=1 Tax=Ammoniphilus sp. 3BR4 TaxID=3158265 RepID=UPI00346521AE
MQKHMIIRNKIRIARSLMKDPSLSKFVPDTVPFSVKKLVRMLKKHKVIYLKPNDGLKGKGIIRVKTVSDRKYEVSYGKKVRIHKFDAMVNKVIQQIGPREDYLIQQGINLATYKDRPYDIRLLLVKHLNRWHLTMISAKVAAVKNAVVTNVSFNRKWLPLEELQHSIYKVLDENDQKVRPMATLREMIDLSYQIANKLGNRFPFYMLGLDLAIDKKGKIWFIEANTSPAIKPMKQVNDRKSYLIVREALKNIEIVNPD